MYIYSETEKLQLQTVQKTWTSLIKQSLKNSFFDPTFPKITSKFNESILPHDIELNPKTKLKKIFCSEECKKR